MIIKAPTRRLPLMILVAAGAAVLSVAPATAEPSKTAAPKPSQTKTGELPADAQMGWRNREAGKLAGADAGVHASAPTGVLGLDVSSYQGNENWPRWVTRGKSFVYVKATQGTSYRNPYFSSQYTDSYYAGMVHGAYHYANPAGRSGTRQARYFVKHGGGWSKDNQTLPGALDIEYGPRGHACYGLSKKRMVRWITAFTTEYKRLTTRNAVIYTTADWWNRCTGNTKKFSSTNALWAARWGTKTPASCPAVGRWPPSGSTAATRSTRTSSIRTGPTSPSSPTASSAQAHPRKGTTPLNPRGREVLTGFRRHAPS